MIPRLAQLVISAEDDQLAPGYRTGRRRIVTELNEIASFPQWFEYAEKMLYRLSINDPEPDLGNNASKLWSQLYPIIAPIATPFPERFEILSRRSTCDSPDERLLCVSALNEILHDSSVRQMNQGTYGNRIAPPAWRPQTWPEYFEYVTIAIQALARLSNDAESKVKEKAIQTLVSSVRSLIFRGILGPAKEGAASMPSEVRPILRAELREFLLLNNSEHSPHSDEEKAQRSRFVSQWIEELAPDNLHDQLVEEIGPDEWEHHLEQAAWEARIRGLALRLLENDKDFVEELPWLNGPKAKSVVEFGIVLGRFDQALSRLDSIVSACKENRSPNLARGYFAGVSERYRDKTASEESHTVQRRLNASLDDVWAYDPILAFYVMTASGEFLRSFERTISAIKAKTLPPGSLQTFQAWNGPVHTSPSEVVIATRTLLEAANNGDKRAANLGIEFIVFLLMRAQPEDKTAYLQLVFSEPRLETGFGLFEQVAESGEKVSAYFTQIFSRALPADPQRGIDIVVRMIESKSYDVSEAGSSLVHTVAKIDPRTLMKKIGDVLLSDGGPSIFVLRKIPIILLPTEVLQVWLEEHCLRGAQVLASFLPRPYLNNGKPELHPIAELVLKQYGDDDQVYARWVSGMTNGQVFAGSIANWVEQRASLAESFVNYPIAAVRRWAKGEIGFAADNATDFRLSEEERY
jgi:hypothetical protein